MPKITTPAMKKCLKWIAPALLFLFMTTDGNSQVQYGRKYRVIAYKNGDLSVMSVSNEVLVVPSMSLFVPNTFTPNGDGLNDTFGVSGEAIQEFSLRIFNRWGQVIFETADANIRWDGTVEGKAAASGVYIYKILAKGNTGGMQVKEGNINLIL